jgi:hypothetical protein
MTDRRFFLRNLALASAVVALKPALSAVTLSAPVAKKETAVAKSSGLGLAEFTRCQGTGFSVEGTGQSLVLAESQSRESGKKVETFVLKFRGDANAPLKEKTYRFSHPELGAFDVFIQPRRVVGGECCYSADFCRLV